MKCICYRLSDSVAIGSVSPSELALMMGSGLGERAPEFIDREIAKFLIENEADTAAFETDWPAFLLTKLGTPREKACRAFVNGRCRGGLSEADALSLIAAKDMPKGVIEVAIIDEALLLPQIRVDRYFRNAVVWDATHVSKSRCDMTKARAIHIFNIRRVRDAELAKLDVSFMRAVEVGDLPEQQRVAATKQILRAIPQTFDLTPFTTPETLKVAWPAELPPRVLL